MSDALTEISKAAKDEVVFMARYGAYKLVRQPKIRTYGEGGQVLRETPPIRYQFREHVLRVRPGRDIVEDPEHVLAPGEETGVKRDCVEFLKAHPEFNKTFWIDGQEPGKPKPYVEDVISAMNEALADLDVEKLQAALDAERSGHNRALLVTSLQSAVSAASAARAKLMAREEVPVTGDGENALEWHEGQTVEELQEVADSAGVEVKGTGADGNVLKGDLVKALRKQTKARERAES